LARQETFALVDPPDGNRIDNACRAQCHGGPLDSARVRLIRVLSLKTRMAARSVPCPAPL
jgi:hypothetical protein